MDSTDEAIEQLTTRLQELSTTFTNITFMLIKMNVRGCGVEEVIITVGDGYVNLEIAGEIIVSGSKNVYQLNKKVSFPKRHRLVQMKVNMSPSYVMTISAQVEPGHQLVRVFPFKVIPEGNPGDQQHDEPANAAPEGNQQ